MPHGSGHHHAGRSSEGLMDAEQTLRTVGLKRGDVMLDAGCGNGFFSLAASKIVGYTGKIYPVDIWEDGIAAVNHDIRHKQISNMEPILGDLTVIIPIADGMIDVCFMANVFHGFVENNEVEPALAEMNRLLRPGGTLAVVEWKKIDSPGPPMEVRLAPQDVEDAISVFGFEKKVEEEIGQFHYVVIFNKK